MLRNLINKLKEDESLQFVYFNNEGGWLFDKKDNHPHVRTREEVLAEEADLEDEEVTEEDIEKLIERLVASDKRNYELGELITALEEQNEHLKGSNERLQTQVSEITGNKNSGDDNFELVTKENEALKSRITELEKLNEELSASKKKK